MSGGGLTDTFVYDGDENRVKAVQGAGYRNLALGVTASSDVNLYWPQAVTDGDRWADSGSGSSGQFAYTSWNGLRYVQLDLGAAYSVDKVVVFHYAADGRTYHNTKTQVSADGVNWTTVFDSAVSGEYPETAAGKTITFSARQVRYVRDYLNGSTSNSANHWVEIEVWGQHPGETTAYVGSHFEWKGSTSTMRKYYYAGGERVAVRVGTTLSYLLADHGRSNGSSSTSITTDSAGAKTDEELYHPWGDDRYELIKSGR